MFSQFLKGSSIHGLKYLVQSDHWLSKLVWLQCITACMTSACVIIYFNVANWNNSPASVTSVHLSLVKNKMSFPMVTVCPKQLDHHGVFSNLIINNLEFIKESSLKEFERAINDVLLDYAYVKWSTKNLLGWKTKDIFEACNEKKYSEEDPKCRFGNLLKAIDASIGDKDQPFITIKEYLAGTLESKRRPTLLSLQRFVEDKYNISLMQNNVTTKNNQLGHLKAYARFFPLSEKPKPIDDYAGKWYRIEKEKLPSVLSFIEDKLSIQATHHLYNVWKLMISDILVKYMDDETIEEAIERINFYTYQSQENTRLLFPQLAFNSTPCGETYDKIEQICQATLTEECQQYCNKIKKANVKMDKILRILEYSSYKSEYSVSGNTAKLLPQCKIFDRNITKEGCWTRIITDKGVCFSSTDALVIPGTGPGQSFQFVLDSGPDQYDSYIDPFGVPKPKFDVIVTPPGHYSVGELSVEENVKKTINEDEYSWKDICDIRVTILQTVTTSEEFRRMAPEKRNCYYPDEVDLDYFPSYSEPNCVLECAWKQAKEQCSCVPWFLKELFPQVQVCEIYGNICFQRLIDGRYELPDKNCGCRQDCDYDNYKVTFEKISNDGKYMSTDYHGTQESNTTNLELLNVINKVVTHKPLNNFAEVKMYVDEKTTLHVIVTATVTAIDMISNIGGTLGLFCGFSILSGVEILYWICKWATTGQHKTALSKISSH